MPKQILDFHPFVGGVSAAAEDGAPLGVASQGAGYDPSRPGLRPFRAGVHLSDLTADPVPGNDFVAVRVDDAVVLGRNNGAIQIEESGGSYTETSKGAEGDILDGGVLDGSAHARTARFAGVGDPMFVSLDQATVCPSMLHRPGAGVPAVTIDGSSVSTTTGAAGERTFPGDTMFGYASFVYDGIQEGPLQAIPFAYGTLAGEITSYTATYEFDPGSFTFGAEADRITHINIYRADVIGQLRSASTLVSSVSRSSMTDTAGVLSFTVVDDGTVGVSFEENAGFSETLQTIEVSYRLTAEVDGYHVVGGITVPGEIESDDGDAMVVVSAPYQPDVLDWTRRWVRLPERPTCIVPFRGRALCFGEQSCYVVDVDAVAVVETLVGFGAVAPQSAAASDAGVLSVGPGRRARFYDGRSVVDLADVATQEVVQTWARPEALVAFDAVENRFAVLTDNGNGPYVAVVYADRAVDRRRALALAYSRPNVLGTFVAACPGLDGALWAWHPTAFGTPPQRGPTSTYSSETAVEPLGGWTSRMVDLPTTRCMVYAVEVYAPDLPAWAGQLAVAVETDQTDAVSWTYEAVEGGRVRFVNPNPKARYVGRVRVSLTTDAGQAVDGLSLVYRPVGPHR
ncbi:MAG: hypothetical protein AAGF99_00480 [Bacteroidota bacterium]